MKKKLLIMLLIGIFNHSIFSSNIEKKIDGTGVVIGIIDAGFDYDNLEFQNINNQSRLIKIPGYSNYYDSHGTEVSEVAGGKNTGVAPNVKILGIVTNDYDEDGFSNTYEMYKILYDNKVRIFNQSFGEDYSILDIDKSDIDEYIKEESSYKFYFEKSKQDSLFIWSAGNESYLDPNISSGLPHYYKELEKGWITVVAVDSDTNEISDYSNRCGVAKNWCIAATGDYYFNTTNTFGEGTSYAAPAVTGTAALIKEKYNWMDSHLIKQTILSTAKDVGISGVDDIYGWGILDIEKALKGPALFDKRLALGDFVDININYENAVFDNDISGDAGVIKRGSGTLILTGNNNYTGESIIKEGSLKLTGQLESQVKIENIGTFISDGGIIMNNIINENGVFINQGTFIKGNYLGGAKSSVESSLDSMIKVKGKVILDNSELKILLPKDNENNPLYITSSSIKSTLFEADKGIEGQFGKTDIPVLLYLGINYNSNDIELNLKRKNVEEYALETFGEDKTKINSAKNLEQVFKSLDKGNQNENIKKELIQLQRVDSNRLPVIFDSISGQLHVSSINFVFQESQLLNRNLSNRLMTNTEQNIWTDINVIKGVLNKDGYARGKVTLYNNQIGIDKNINETLKTGVSVSLSNIYGNFNKEAGKSEFKNIGISVYGKYNNDNLYFLSRVGVTHMSESKKRDIILSNHTDKVTSTNKNNMLSIYEELGYELEFVKNNKIYPFIGLSYDGLQRGKIEETNSLFAIKAGKKYYNKLSGLIGLKSNTNFNWKEKNITLQTNIGFNQLLSKKDLSFEGNYAGSDSEKITVKGVDLNKNSIQLGVGISTVMKNNWSWNLNYEIQLRDQKNINNMFTAGIRLNVFE